MNRTLYYLILGFWITLSMGIGIFFFRLIIEKERHIYLVKE